MKFSVKKKLFHFPITYGMFCRKHKINIKIFRIHINRIQCTLETLVILIKIRGNVCYISSTYKKPSCKKRDLTLNRDIEAIQEDLRRIALWELPRQPNYYFALRHPSLASLLFRENQVLLVSLTATMSPLMIDIAFSAMYEQTRSVSQTRIPSWITITESKWKNFCWFFRDC